MKIRHLAAGLILTTAVALGQEPQPTVVINEFTAINDSGLQDEEGDFSDWIELHNFGAKPVDLGGAALTDSPKRLMKWTFPETKLEAGQFLVVFMSGKDRGAKGEPLHASFALRGKGDYLALIGSDGKSVIDQLAPKYPDQKKDISYGILPSRNIRQAESRKRSFLTPTPGKANAQPLAGTIKPVKFSEKRGWHHQSFQLQLKTKTKDATIRFTLDGTHPTAENGLVYASPINIAKTTTLRTAAFKQGYKPSVPTTRTFLFSDDIVRQSPDGLPPEHFPFTWGNNKVDYGMDQRIVNDPRFAKDLIKGFHLLPSFSLVMNLNDLFDAKRGIYANAEWDGREAERPCSIELIDPNGEKGFQIDCGIRIRGGFSRRSNNPKHSFRFFFRDTYGPSKLDYPLFGNKGAKEFDNIDLRTFQNYSWHIGDKERTIFLRDQFNRDLQLAMGQPAARGKFYHLFINGHYWGVYNTCERIKASYGASYLGGKKENYDAIKKGRTYLKDRDMSIGVMANDGNLDAWGRLCDIAREGLELDETYFKMLGKNPDGTGNLNYECLLEVDNLIDYMLVIFYGGNYDAPVSAWGQNFGPNNWYGLRHRKKRDGFRFFVWDAEHTLRDVREDRTGPFPAGNHYSSSNPQWIWQQCLDNEEFRIRVGDRIQKHFYNGGALTPDMVQKQFRERIDEIEMSVVCESARWGDSSYTPSGGQASTERPPRNRDDDWIHEINRLVNDYFPARSEIVLSQLYRHGVISDVAAPVYQLNGDKSQVSIQARNGDLFVTTDGSDPRQIGGKASTTSKRIESNKTTLPIKNTIHSRAFYKDEWSALIKISK
ncbi:MAG: CotH kinase family protein [Verrucomicrobiota bacterium]|jgi:hypothetical protein|nr:CotH kinase family protein [Verrucomicrobiota bacterium]MDP7049184.1 CotH kinase family protein [Verrucomicrobiota bacterium]